MDIIPAILVLGPHPNLISESDFCSVIVQSSQFLFKKLTFKQKIYTVEQFVFGLLQ